MRTVIALLLGVLLPSAAAHAQAVQVWARSYIGVDPVNARLVHTEFQRPLLLPNGNFLTSAYIQGGSQLGTSGNIWLLNSQGDTIRAPWRRGDYSSLSSSVRGDIIALGYEGIAGTDSVFFERLSANGTVRWHRGVYTKSGVAGNGYAPFQGLPDGGVISGNNKNLSPPGASGARIPEAEVTRLDSAGRVVWRRQYGGPYTQLTNLVAQADGSYALVGQHLRPVTPGPGYLVADAWVQRIRISGDTIGPPQYIGTLADGEYVNNAQPTANGGLLLAGFVGPNWYSNQAYQGWLVQLDSLGQVQWQQQVAGQLPGTSNNACAFNQVWPLQDGGILVKGLRKAASPPNVNYTYLARYAVNAAGTGAAPTWEQFPTVATNYGVLAATGELTMAGRSNQYTTPMGGYAGELTRFAQAGVPYQPPLCRRPPVAQAGYALNPTRDTLRLVDFSAGGPRYAQVLAWRWDFGDGRSYTGGPQPPAHGYAAVPAAGTPVRLTVTNNLGCATTQTIYPWGQPTASQQAQAVAAQSSVYPNPATAEATLALAGLPPHAAATVQTYNALSQVVGPRRPLAVAADGTAALRLTVAGWPAGVYVLRVQAGALSVAKRLVVQ